MLKNKKISFIGSGAMGGAMIAGLLRKGVASPHGLFASDPLQERLVELQRKYQINIAENNREVVNDADVIVLSVKPQKLDAVLVDLKGFIPSGSLVLSIIAGMPVELITTGLGHDKVVRAMPNTPAQIGEGITVWTAAPTVSELQRDMARQILLALGEEVFMEEEQFLDAATAISGTGPAYVFLFMEAMVDAGVHLGFSRKIAEKLVSQTVRGSADFYLHYLNIGDEVHLAHLRNQVTSPAGTSAAAIYYLEKAGFRTALSRAIWAAYERSVELGQGRKTRPPENR